MGTDGGVEAARLLCEAVKAELKSHDDGISTIYAGASEWRIMVRVYANFAGLSAALVRAGLQKSVNDLNKFAGGFTRGQPLFDFVDAGIEKEGADHKIRGKPQSHYSVRRGRPDPLIPRILNRTV